MLMSRKILILPSLPNKHTRLLREETTAKKLQSFWLMLAVQNAQIPRGNESLLVNCEKNN